MLLFGPWYHLRKQNDINGKITSLGIGMNFSSDSYWKSFRASQVALVIKNLPANAGDAGNTGEVGSVPGSGRCPGEDHDNPLQYSCLENSMNRGGWQAIVHRVAKSRTRLKWLRTAQSFKDLFKEDGAKTQFSSFLEPSLPVPCPRPPAPLLPTQAEQLITALCLAWLWLFTTEDWIFICTYWNPGNFQPGFVSGNR